VGKGSSSGKASKHGMDIPHIHYGIYENTIIDIFCFQLDKTIRTYNALAYSIGLLPSSAPKAKGHNFELVFYPNAETPEKMISVDLRNFVKPALQQIEFEMKEQENSLREANLQIQEKLDAIVEQTIDKSDELKLLQQRLNQRNEEYEHAKEVY